MLTNHFIFTRFLFYFNNTNPKKLVFFVQEKEERIEEEERVMVKKVNVNWNLRKMVRTGTQFG